jgi:asparagine synthase (glutamine-hydrolysing)|nr:asparagine synthase (glutamine-hydrolyzing) [Solirubrobacteraceae bacterium]
MCGICGLARLDGAGGVDARALAAMSATLVHRGPDSHGEHLDGPIGLAARRLAIVDVAGGDQPIASEDGAVTVVQNGEIYNAPQLRAELVAQGHVFRTRSDTEVLAHLYEQEGTAFAARLRGMFAVAIWDAPRSRLVLARDAFGIKPLFWSAAGRVMSFASELRALACAPGFSRELDLDAIEAYLAFNSIPAPLTIYRAARKLPAGHLLVWEPGATPRVERWARPAPVAAGDVRHEPLEVLAAELRERLADSVRAHLMSDVPVGVLLSGGVDSSLLTALAARESGERVRTFSIGFEERSFDELAHARMVAERYGTEHHELVLRPDAAELLPQIAAAFDEPSGDSSALPTYLVSRLASEHVKVALSGEGGDELFGGYETYVADLLAARVGRAARVLEPVVARLPSSSRRVSLDYKAKRFVAGAHLPALERHHAWKEIFSADARAALRDGAAAADRACRTGDGVARTGDGVARTGDGVARTGDGGRRAGDGDRSTGDGAGATGAGRRAPADPLDVLRARYAETAGAEPLARLQDVDLGVYLVDDLLAKTDRMSMAHSLELRVPFLDPHVAELAFALPTSAKVRGRAKKRVLRRAAEPLVPRAIARGRKRGFSIPAAAWLRGPLEPFAREVLAPERTRRQGLFDPRAVAAVLDSHVAREADLSRQLWGLLSLSLWLG